MHGVTVRLTRTVLPRGLKNPPSLTRRSASRSHTRSLRLLGTPAVCGEEGPLDRATRAGTHTVGHNSVATFEVPRESVLENRGNAQPEYPLRGILAH